MVLIHVHILESIQDDNKSDLSPTSHSSQQKADVTDLDHDNDNDNDKREETMRTGKHDRSFPHWVIKHYHANVMFYTVCCMVAIIAYQNLFVVVVAYIGLLGKFVQLAGLFLSNERVCQIAHSCTVVCNIILLLTSIINYGEDTR